LIWATTTTTTNGWERLSYKEGEAEGFVAAAAPIN